MRIALVIEQFDPEGGGAERSSGQIVKELVRRGHEVTVLAGRCREDLELSGTRILRCPSGPPRRGLTIPPFVRWARLQAEAEHLDVSLAVVTWLPADVLQPRSGVLAEARARYLARRKSALGRLGKRLEFLLTPKHRLMMGLERRQLSGTQVRRFVAISRYMKEQLMRHYGIEESRIALIPNGAEVPDPDPEWRGKVRERFGIDDAAPLFLFVAHDPWRKGLPSLLRALGRLPDRHVLLVAGAVRSAMRRMVAELGLEERVRFAGETGNTSELYCAADATVLPSYYDPASKVVLESVMLGTPAITTAYNGARDCIDGGDHPLRGRVVDDPDDVEGLARAMAELADPEEQRRCRAATEGLAEELSMRRHAERLELVLAEVAREKANS